MINYLVEKTNNSPKPTIFIAQQQSFMLCFFSSDLHGKIDRYEKLFDKIEKEKPDAVFSGGDFYTDFTFKVVQFRQSLIRLFSSSIGIYHCNLYFTFGLKYK